MPLLSTFGAASARAFGMGTVGGESYWIARYAPSTNRNNEYIYGVDVDSSGNVYCTGVSATNPYNNAVYMVLSSDGEVTTFKDLGRTNIENVATNDYFTNCFLDGNGYLITCGQSIYNTGNTLKSIIAKFDISDGSLNTATELQYENVATAVKPDRSSSSTDIYVLSPYASKVGMTKLQSDLSLRWQKEYNVVPGHNSRFIAAHDVDTSGNVYIVGSYDSNTTNRDVATIFKINSSGTIQWTKGLQKTSPTAGHCRFNNVAVDSSGNAFTVGYTPDNSYMVCKYSSSGTLSVAKKLTGPNQQLRHLAIDSEDNVIVGGYDSTGSLSGDSPYIIKLNNSLNTIAWARHIDRAVDLRSSGISVDASDNIYVHGTDAENDFFVAKIPSDGSLTGTYSNYKYETFSVSVADATDLNATTATLYQQSGSMAGITTNAGTLPSSNRTVTVTKDTI